MKLALGTLKDKGEELAAFLEPRVGTKPQLSGDSMEIDDKAAKKGMKPRKVKTYIKRFLYMNGIRKSYRVFVEGDELTVQEIELSEAEQEEKEKVAEKMEKAEKEESEERKPEGKKEKAVEEKEEEPKPEAEEAKPAPEEKEKEKPKAPKGTKKAAAPKKKD